MSNISLFEKPWIDLVFENRNKSYGAYSLRRNDGRTTLLAFLSGLCIVGIATLIPMLANILRDTPTSDPVKVQSVPTIHLVKVIPHKTMPRAREGAMHTVSAQTIFRNPVPVRAAQVDIFAPNLSQTANNTNDTPIDMSQGSTQRSLQTEAAEAPKTPVVNTTADVDRLPEFPGGLSKFYEFVSSNFANFEVDETVTVLMSFVVEVDGSITDIAVLRSPGHGIDKEAIRVLQSLHTKWKPGFKDGVPVRTRYNFPIKIKSD